MAESLYIFMHLLNFTGALLVPYTLPYVQTQLLEFAEQKLGYSSYC